MKLHEIVSGVEVKELNAYKYDEEYGRDEGYNTLAEAEVVVDRDKIQECINEWADRGISLVNIIATAIEKGEIVKLREDKDGR